MRLNDLPKMQLKLKKNIDIKSREYYQKIGFFLSSVWTRIKLFLGIWAKLNCNVQNVNKQHHLNRVL